ncbi:TrmH family RNA methyltransferase [Mycoplasmopsis columbinasalis]|uniref:tRNA/rRNA methylase n=1 Tax=Mycoplasmopsis columbinasalis TaxID=114880 RepID=A0A449BAE0_9BACT|nr:RNA methyltransferase [Mycoplasmopsis columbinasalis]VEU78164.1 tRNA/rRNA methylase [Mycoplasmopsis columbinasalis]
MAKEIITSVANQKIKNLIKLKNDPKSPYFLVETRHLVKEAEKANLVKEIFATYETEFNKQNYIIGSNIAKRLSEIVNTDGVFALCQKPTVEDLDNKIVFLDNVQDPGNVGTIIRTLKAFNFDSIITNVNVFNSKVIRSTQGAIFSVKHKKSFDSYAELKKLKDLGYKIYITSLDKDSQHYDQVPTNFQKLVVVLGNEGKGVEPKLLELADYKIYIPINFESLNVAVASGIILNEFYKKR